MIERPIADMVADPATKDRRAIETLLNSAEWEEQLRVARLKREKVLAERAAGNEKASVQTQDTVVGPPLSSPSQSGVGTISLEFLPAVQKNEGERVPARAMSRWRGGLGVAGGLMAGVAFGLILQPLARDLVPGLALLDKSAPVTVSAKPPGLQDHAARLVALPGSNDKEPRASTSAPADRMASAARGSAGMAAIAANEVAPQVLSWAPAMALDGSPVAGTGIMQIPMPAGVPLFQTDGSRPTLMNAAGIESAVDEVLSPNPPHLVALGLAPGTLPTLTDRASLSGLVPTRTKDAPDLATGSTPVIVPPEHDGIPRTGNVPYVDDAASLYLNLHLSQATDGLAIREKLAELGIVNTAISRSSFASATNMVAYYRPEDAAIARILALIFDATVMDMVGFAPGSENRTMDLYLTG